MSTDIAMARVRKVHVDSQVSTGTRTIVCLWAVVGLALTVLMCRFGFDGAVAGALATAG